MNNKKYFKMIAEDKFLLYVLILVNIAGTLFGFWYYRFQLPETPFYKMIFVPDCPLYALMFAILMAAYIFPEKKSATLATITFVGLIKYGFWTVLVVTLYRDHYFTADPLLYSMLFTLHIGMIAEAFIIPHIFRFTKETLLIALGWFLLNDVMDYFFGTVPYLPDSTFLSGFAIESFLVTIILVIYSRRFMKRL